MYVFAKTGYLILRHIIGDKNSNTYIPATTTVSKTFWHAGANPSRYLKSVLTVGTYSRSIRTVNLT